MPATGDSTSEKEAVLGKLLEQHKASEYELPALQADFSEIKSFVKEVKDFLRSLLDSFDVPINQQATPLIGQIIEASIYLVLFAAIAAALIWLAFRIAESLKQPKDGISRDATITGLLMQLEQELKQAQEAGLWARALRIRWKLFLFECNKAPFITPQEFFTAADEPTSTKPLHLAKDRLSHLYTLMFGSAGTDKGGYQQYETLLEQYEKQLNQPDTGA